MDAKKARLIQKLLIVSISICLVSIVGLIIIIALYKAPEEEQLGDESLIEVYNITIEDFEKYSLGLLHDNKYYSLQYGVHVKDKSYIGEELGKTSRKNELTSVGGDVYEYSENASYLIEDSSSFYSFVGDEDVLLVDTGSVDTTINGVWVISPSLLKKTSLYDFIEDSDNVVLTYYPNIDCLDISFELDNEESSDFCSSLVRVSTPDASQVMTGYITFDDDSGLIYGAYVYYDLLNGTFYLSPPTYSSLYFKAYSSLSNYIAEYFISYSEYSKAHELDLSY